MLTFRIKRTLKMGIKSLWIHKLRSILTALGIILGVCSVIAMLAIGEGASYEAQQQIRELGSQNIIVNSVRPPEESTVSSKQNFALVYGLTYADAARIHSTIPNVKVIVPARSVPKHLRHGARRVDGAVVGVPPWHPQVVRRKVIRGRFFSAVDMDECATVCVLNEPVVRELFPFEDPLGKTVWAGDAVYRVVGILRAQSAGARKQSGSNNLSSGFEMYIPISTAQAWFGNINFKRRSGSHEATVIDLHRITVQVENLDNVHGTARAIERILEYGHEKKDYEIVVPLDLLEKAKRTQQIFSIVLGSIAAISLVVGGVGIMNIMLATVTERTREIGIRRALGARRKDIVTQFLIETVILASTGGVLGVTLGVLIPYLVTKFAGMLTIVTPWSCGLAFGISVAVGLIFGLYPAYRAAAMDPIQALRHE